jgi:Zn-finger nucleic acid-binding protein
VTDPAPKCPRCSEPLAQVALKGVDAQSCPKCGGTSLAQLRLMAVLEAMSVELLETFNPDTKLDPVPDRGAGLPCPRCQRPMTTADYCGANLVTFDRCESCAFLWIDADELGTMTLMWARMDARRSRLNAQVEEMIDGMDSLIRSQRIKRTVQRALFAGATLLGL